MNTRSHKLALLGALLVPLFVASCGGSGGGAAVEDDSPEGTAFHYRDGLMQAVSWKMARIGGMAQGDIPVNEAEFVKSARDLAVLAGMIPEGFIPNSIVKGSAALPAIWTNMSDFEAKAKALQDGAQGLADAAASGGFEGAKGMVAAVRQTCGGCHRTYRQRQE
jgi:cytochrome c556